MVCIGLYSLRLPHHETLVLERNFHQMMFSGRLPLGKMDYSENLEVGLEEVQVFHNLGQRTDWGSFDTNLDLLGNAAC